MNSTSRSAHISILDPLRGIAALAVVLFHYSGPILPSISPNLLTPFFAEGKLGVQVFFVISGFVIPYSMHRAGYALPQLGSFMWRRWKRIAPPAYVAALFMILYHFSSVLITGHAVSGSDFPGCGIHAILANLTFTAGYWGIAWYNFVYWTLTIEFEFYLLIGLSLPLIMRDDPRWLRPSLLILILALAFIDLPTLLTYIHYFVLGLLVFLYREDRLSRAWLASLAGLCFIVGMVHGQYLGPLVGTVTALLIFSGMSCGRKIATRAGAISYSLYITHIPVGYFAESITKRVINLHEYPAGKLVLLFFYTALALIFADLFHRFIEKPVLRWSKKGDKMVAAQPSIEPDPF